MPTKVFLTANKVALLGLVLAPMMFFLSLFFFDDPSSASNPFAWGMAVAVWSYPFTVGFGGLRALRAYQAGDFNGLTRWTCLTYSSLAAFLVSFAGAAFLEIARSS